MLYRLKAGSFSEIRLKPAPRPASPGREYLRPRYDLDEEKNHNTDNGIFVETM